MTDLNSLEAGTGTFLKSILLTDTNTVKIMISPVSHLWVCKGRILYKRHKRQ